MVLVVWNMAFIFPCIGTIIIIPNDFHIFQRGWNHRPDIYIYIYTGEFHGFSSKAANHVWLPKNILLAQALKRVLPALQTALIFCDAGLGWSCISFSDHSSETNSPSPTLIRSLDVYCGAISRIRERDKWAKCKIQSWNSQKIAQHLTLFYLFLLSTYYIMEKLPLKPCWNHVLIILPASGSRT